MPRLPNILYEKEAKTLVKNGFNKTQTYLDHHPKASYDTAHKNVAHYMAKYGIEKRALELVQESDKLNLDSAINKLAEKLDAKKEVVYKGKIIKLIDNTTQLSTLQFLLEKIYGLGRQEINQDNRQLTVNISGVETSKVSNMLGKLQSLNETMLSKTSSQDGEINDKPIDNTIEGVIDV